MLAIHEDDLLKVGKLISKHLDRTYVGIAAIRTFLPVRHLDEETKLVFILLPELFCLKFLKEHLILSVEFLADEPKTAQLESIYSNLLSKICSYVYVVPNTERNKRLICSVFSDHLLTHKTHVEKDYLIDDLETNPTSDSTHIHIKSTIDFAVLSYFGRLDHISDTSACWNFDPVLWKNQFGEN